MGHRLFPGVAALVAVVVAGAVLAGCQDTEGVAAPVRPPTSESAAPSASASDQGQPDSPSPSPPEPSDEADDSAGGTSPPAQGDARPGEVTVTGGVEAGVELGCLLLRASARTYLLIGGDRSKLRVGGTVTVRGTVEPGLMSTCQQGTPLRILDIEAG
jgi:hypothetical protein